MNWDWLTRARLKTIERAIMPEGLLDTCRTDTREPVMTFTVCHPQAFFLPLWKKHYSKLGAIRVLEHQSSNFDEYWTRVNEFQMRLLRLYKIVIFASVDEFLVPLDRITEMKRPTAYHVIDVDQEFPLDLDLPILRQRTWWIRDGSYDKPMIVTEPLVWGWGLHCKTEQEYIPVDPELLLLHLDRADYDQCKKGHRWYTKHPYVGPIDYPFKEPEFSQWFFTGLGNKTIIPEKYKELL